jgi:hypothetical protein
MPAEHGGSAGLPHAFSSSLVSPPSPRNHVHLAAADRFSRRVTRSFDITSWPVTASTRSRRSMTASWTLWTVVQAAWRPAESTSVKHDGEMDRLGVEPSAGRVRSVPVPRLLGPACPWKVSNLLPLARQASALPVSYRDKGVAAEVVAATPSHPGRRCITPSRTSPAAARRQSRRAPIGWPSRRRCPCRRRESRRARRCPSGTRRLPFAFPGPSP